MRIGALVADRTAAGVPTIRSTPDGRGRQRNLTALIDRALKALAREAEKDEAVRAVLHDFPPDEVMSELEKNSAGGDFWERCKIFSPKTGREQ